MSRKPTLPKSEYQNIFEGAHDGILIIDIETKTIIAANRSITEILGYSKKEFLNKNIFDIGCIKDLKALRKALLQLKTKKYTRLDNLPLEAKDGKAISGECIISICPIGHKKVIRCDIRDITDRLAAELALKESETQLKVLFEENRDGLLVAEENTRHFLLCNKTICSWLGYTAKELKTLRVEDIHPQETVKASIETFEKLRRRDINRVETMAMLRKDGSVFYADLTVTPILLKGRPCLLGSFRDATERLRLEAIKNNFMNLVSHELRTPLCAIKESFALVLEGVLGPITSKQKSMLTIAKNNIDRLARLINQVLNIQRFESGMVLFSFKENSINSVLENIYNLTYPIAHKKGLQFILQLDPSIPPSIFDRDQIEQVLLNLVENAIKFTDTKNIVLRTKKKQNHVQVSIEDSGRGIKKEDIPKLFTRFIQLEPKVQGTGLGLAICQDIITAHKGKIWIESTFGKGTKVHFTLPL